MLCEYTSGSVRSRDVSDWLCHCPFDVGASCCRTRKHSAKRQRAQSSQSASSRPPSDRSPPGALVAACLFRPPVKPRRHPTYHPLPRSTSDTPPVYYVLQIELDLLITDFSDGPDPLAPQIRGAPCCCVAATRRQRSGQRRPPLHSLTPHCRRGQVASTKWRSRASGSPSAIPRRGSSRTAVLRCCR